MTANPEAWRAHLKRAVEAVDISEEIAVHENTTLVKPKNKLHPTIQDLWDLIEHEPEVREYFTLMLEQVPTTPPFDKNPKGGPQFRDWKQLLRAFDYQIDKAPIWIADTENQFKLLGFPFTALLVSPLLSNASNVTTQLTQIPTRNGPWPPPPA